MAGLFSLVLPHTFEFVSGCQNVTGFGKLYRDDYEIRQHLESKEQKSRLESSLEFSGGEGVSGLISPSVWFFPTLGGFSSHSRPGGFGNPSEGDREQVGFMITERP